MSTVALVQVNVDDTFNDSGHSTESGAVQGAVVSAVTDWINETESGRKAWEESCEDFNIGDLCECLDDESLRARLSRYGIGGMEICITDGSESQWTFDEILVNTPDLSA